MTNQNALLSPPQADCLSHKAEQPIEPAENTTDVRAAGAPDPSVASMTDDERIDRVAEEVLRAYRFAFEELAK